MFDWEIDCVGLVDFDSEFEFVDIVEATSLGASSVPLPYLVRWIHWNHSCLRMIQMGVYVV